MITFEHVTKTYIRTTHQGNSLRTALSFQRVKPPQEFTSLKNVSFSLSAGESLGILGHNGAGKSTLLKLLTRVTRPSKGRIVVDGSIASLLEVGAGFHLDMTGLENIYLSGAILGMSPNKIRKHLDEIIDFSGIEAFLDQPIRTYSSGMFLRLAFSVGIHFDSDILIIDEALAVGDAQFQQKCVERISRFKRHGGTLIFVSHDQQQLRNVCERGLVLDHGQSVFDGDIDSALEHYNKLTKGEICNS